MTRHPPATVVVLAWNAWEETQACLESLRPTLGAHDQVVLVDNGSTDGTASRLRLFHWVEVITNEKNLGFAAGCNQGAAAARHDVIVFLNNDTVLNGHWLDALVAPFEEPGVGATGPRSNFVSGPQVAEGASYASGDRAGIRRFARAWTEDHRREVTPTDRLVGFCMAVRRSAFEAIGGFDEGYEVGGFEDDDLCRRLTDAGWTLLITHESFVHHNGHRTFDVNGVDWFAQQEINRGHFEEKFGDRSDREFALVSACMIVRDEVDNLPSCLASLRGFADEMVIYDTGSVDGTVALARELGATVIEGYWDDDFSRARNTALAACTGEWIAWLDADETMLCGDVGALRELLVRTGPEVEGYSIAIENATGSGVGAMFVHSACRLFRRASCEWTGRLHEQVAGRQGHHPVATMALDRARIHHTGYTDQAMLGRGKAERNLRVAEAEVAGSDGWDRGFSLTSLGRSYMTAGRPEEALETCRRGAEETKNPITRRLAHRTIVEALVALDRPGEAREWLGRLRAVSDRQILADLLEANIFRHEGDHERALAVLESLGTGEFDDDGFEYDASMFAQPRAASLVALDRFSEAADVLLGVLSEKSILDTHLGNVVDYLDRAGRPLSDLAAALPGDQVQLFLAQVLQLQPEVGDRVLEACVERGGTDDLSVLATAATLARHLPVERALVWSSRLRERGLGHVCPLVFIAGDAQRPATERARAAAAGYRMFSDPRLSAAFPVCLAAADAEEREAILGEVEMLCPQLLGKPSGGAAPEGSSADSGSGGLPVSIVIPCWNKSDYTLRCLQSIQAHTPPGAYEVILVDNGSTDATATLTPDAGDRSFRVLRNPDNLGFAHACNQGAKAARHNVVVFLNNDVEVLPGWLAPLQDAFLGHPEVGVVGARLLFPGGTLQHAGVVVGYSEDGLFDGFHLHYRLPGTHPPALERRAVRAVTGAVMAVRRSVFEEVGGFDEEYWNGNEDVDLCLKIGERGWQVIYEPACCAVHHESVSGPERFSALEANRKRFTLRWKDKVIPDAGGPSQRGVNVLASFSAATEDGQMSRAVVDSLEAAGVPVVTTSLSPDADLVDPGSGWFRHRLGPVQDTTVVCIPESATVTVVDTPAWRDATHRIALWPPVGREPTGWQQSLTEAAEEHLAAGNDRTVPGSDQTLAERCAALVREHLDATFVDAGDAGAPDDRTVPGCTAVFPVDSPATRTVVAAYRRPTIRLEIGGGTHPDPGWDNLDPVHGAGELRRRLQDGIPMEDSSVDLVRASHVMEHIPPEDRIHCMNEVHRVLKPGGMFEVIVPLFPSWQAMADPTHVSYWVEQSFWYFTGQWAPQADYGMSMWRWATTAEVEQRWRDRDPGPVVRAEGPAPWLVVDGWEGHALMVKPEPAR